MPLPVVIVSLLTCLLLVPGGVAAGGGGWPPADTLHAVCTAGSAYRGWDSVVYPTLLYYSMLYGMNNML